MQPTRSTEKKFLFVALVVLGGLLFAVIWYAPQSSSKYPPAYVNAGEDYVENYYIENPDGMLGKETVLERLDNHYFMTEEFGRLVMEDLSLVRRLCLPDWDKVVECLEYWETGTPVELQTRVRVLIKMKPIGKDLFLRDKWGVSWIRFGTPHFTGEGKDVLKASRTAAGFPPNAPAGGFNLDLSRLRSVSGIPYGSVAKQIDWCRDNMQAWERGEIDASLSAIKWCLDNQHEWVLRQRSEEGSDAQRRYEEGGDAQRRYMEEMGKWCVENAEEEWGWFRGSTHGSYGNIGWCASHRPVWELAWKESKRNSSGE